MPTVNAEIKRILREKDAGIIDGIEAVRELLQELQRQTLNELGKAATGSWDAYQLKNMIREIERQTANFDTRAKKEIGNYLDDMWELGKESVYKPLAVAGMYTGFGISKSSLEALKDYTFGKISGLADDAFVKIKGELTLGVLGGKTPQEVAAAIGRNLDDPSIFATIDARAEAITKTEMGRVFSKSAQTRMEEAAQYVDGLEKQWIHGGHPKMPRPYHLALDGHHIPVDEPFDVGGVTMMYPRDPAAPIGEVINCGCSHAPWHERWQ